MEHFSAVKFTTGYEKKYELKFLWQKSSKVGEKWKNQTELL